MKKTDVIIVVAGPAALALGCQLIRFAIEFVIFDKKETTTPFSKALGGRARTLEIYEQIGPAVKLTEFGAIASPKPGLSYLLTHNFPYMGGAAFSIEAVKEFIFPRISQIGINYRRRSLSEISGGRFAVKSPDRTPYSEVEGACIYGRRREPKFHLLALFHGENKRSETAENDLFDFHEFSFVGDRRGNFRREQNLQRSAASRQLRRSDYRRCFGR